MKPKGGGNFSMTERGKNWMTVDIQHLLPEYAHLGIGTAIAGSVAPDGGEGGYPARLQLQRSAQLPGVSP